MATKAPVLLLALAVAALLAAAPAEPAHSPPSAPAPAPDCQTELAMPLASCYSFVANGSTDKVPDKDCCKGLATVIKDSLFCICQLAHDPNSGNGQAAQLGLDPKRVAMLPQACKTTVPADKCAKLGLPVTVGAVGAATAGPAPASAPSAGGPGAGAGATAGTAPSPSSRSPSTSPGWAMLIAAVLPVLALATSAL